MQQGYKKEVKVPKIGGGTPKGKGKGKEKAAVEESDEEDFVRSPSSFTLPETD